MFNEDKTISLVFNGEIYNYRGLRKNLEAKHIFRTQSDTEVLVHLYEEHGDDFLKKIEGMFAVALWDSKQKRMLLARDRFGEKPLYWTIMDGALVFASESKALFCHPGVRRELDRASLGKYMFYEHIPAPATIYRGIFKMPPAHFGVYEKGEMRVHEYFSLLPSRELHISEGEALEQLDVMLDRVIASRLVSDVPLGIFLSGGIDSSTIAYYAEKHSIKPIKTFSISFEKESYDESRWARMVADSIGSEHYTHTFTKKDFFGSVRKISELLDEPMADPSILPTYLLSQFTRSRVTVALGGDGGDELLLGYQTFRAHRLWPLFRALPGALRKGVAAAIGKLPVSSRYFSADFVLKKFIEGGNDRPLLRNQLWLGAFQPSEYRMLFSQNILADFLEDALYDDIDEVEGLTSQEELYRQLSYAYLRHYLAGEILTKDDRASMYNSLEVRSPFLDSQLACFLFNMPRALKLRGLTGKYILKKLMVPRIGRRAAYRKKQGFALPLASWLKGDLKNFRDEYLKGSRMKHEGIFNATYIARLLDEHDRGAHDHRKRIWTLLIFQMWNERYGHTV